MKKWLAGIAGISLWATAALGAQNIAAGTSVTQNFDSIGVSATATLPTDWKVDKQTTVRTLGTYAAAGSATEQRAGANMSSSAANGIYNYGAPTTAATERAVGWISSSSATKSGNLYVQMVNSGGASITNLAIAYNVEQYRNGTNTAGFQMQMYYSTDGSTWTSAGASFLTTFSPNADNTGYATPPGTTVVVSASLDLSAAPVPSSGNLYLAWNYSVQSGTTTSGSQALGVDDISISVPGEATLGVTFDQANGFNIEQGSTDVITATAANGTEPYGYTWSSSLSGSYYQTNANQFTILATAPAGSYTATVVVADAAAQGVTNSIGFNVVMPYGITITTPTNGTVTTAPASQAFAGETVTISPTADDGYRVASITVVDELSNPVTVTGNTFTMPASAVTVTVNFEVYDAPDILLNFETNSTLSTSAYTAGTTDTVNSVALTHQNFLRGGGTTDWKNGNYAGRLRYQTGTNGLFYNTSAFAQPITKIDFWYANFGSDTSVTFKVQVSPNGTDWTDVGDAAYDPSSTNLVEATIDSIPANMTHVQFITIGGTSGQRVNIDDIGFWYGTASFGVNFDRAGGFVVTQGVSEVITATAANGTEPYGYAWSSSLDGSYYSTNATQFTVLATAPAGSYSATVVATDAGAQSVTNTLNFSVETAYAITVSPTTNGTATTTPSGSALAGATITIVPSADPGYKVNMITVLDATSNLVTLTGNTFTMPASAVTVTVTFRPVSDTATLPTSWSGPWTNAFLPDGWTNINLGTDYAGNYDSTGGGAAKFDTTGDILHIKYGSSATELTYWLMFNGTWTNSNVFKVQESVNGTDWTDLAVFNDGNQVPTSAAKYTNTPAADSRYIRFIYDTRGGGNVGLDGVSLTGDVLPAVMVAGSLSGTQGAEMNLTITLTNGTAASWLLDLRDPTNGVVSTYNWTAGTGAFSFTPAQVGSYSLTATALDGGSAPIAATNVTLTISSSLPPTVEISNITLALNGTGNFNFTVPTGYTLSVLGADTALTGGNWAWSNLIQGVHYTVSGSNVTITTVSGSRQIIRIRLTP